MEKIAVFVDDAAHAGQLLRPLLAPGAEPVRWVIVGCAPRLTHRHATVFDAVLALIMVKIIRLAIGQHNQQLARRHLFGQHGRGVADRGTQPCIMARPQRADIGGNGRPHLVVKPFATGQKHPITAQR